MWRAAVVLLALAAACVAAPVPAVPTEHQADLSVEISLAGGPSRSQSTFVMYQGPSNSSRLALFTEGFLPATLATVGQT